MWHITEVGLGELRLFPAGLRVSVCWASLQTEILRPWQHLSKRDSPVPVQSKDNFQIFGVIIYSFIPGNHKLLACHWEYSDNVQVTMRMQNSERNPKICVLRGQHPPPKLRAMNLHQDGLAELSPNACITSFRYLVQRSSYNFKCAINLKCRPTKCGTVQFFPRVMKEIFVSKAWSEKFSFYEVRRRSLICSLV